MSGDLTMSNANIHMSDGKTVDGVDVSELESKVATNEKDIDDLKKRGDEQKSAFAHGKAVFSSSNATCSGTNIVTGGSSLGPRRVTCYFSTPTGTSNYTVVATSGSNSSCSGQYVIPGVLSKSSGSFTIDVVCPNGSNPSGGGTTLEFVVFKH